MLIKSLILALDWSEVWALLIPLFASLINRVHFPSLKPLIVYLWIALILNFIIDVIMGMNIYTDSFLQSNNPLYNIHSIVRFTCFSYYFIHLKQSSFMKLRITVPLFFIVVIFINFIYFEDFFNPDYLSGNLMSAESYLLLVYCMQYYLSELKDDDDNIFRGPDFWIVTGLSIYVVVNFFVFLFYVPMLNTDTKLATNIWDVHNISFIIFCLFITKAIYVPVRNKYTS